MSRFDFLPSYHYEVNTDGIINNPAVKELRNCKIYGADGGVGDLNGETGKYNIPVTVNKNLLDMSKITGGRTARGYTTSDTITVRCSVKDGIVTLSVCRYGLGTVLYDTKTELPPGKYVLSADCRMEHDDKTYNGLSFGVIKYSPENYSEVTTILDEKWIALRKWKRLEKSFTLDEASEIAVCIQPTGDKNNYLNVPLKIKNICLAPISEEGTVNVEMDAPLGEGESVDIPGIEVPYARNVITVGTAVEPSAVEYEYYTY